MTSGENLNYQITTTEETKLPGLAKLGQETEIDYSGKMHNKHAAGEPYDLFGIDWYRQWPEVRVRKSTGTKKTIKFFENLINLCGIPEKKIR